MQTDIQEIYQKTILPLPEKEQLKLASLILERVTKEDATEQPTRKGDIAKFSGMFKGGDPDGSDNDKIDADLARYYLEDYEQSKS
ncbi:MAG: hypothetical protein M3Q33_11310 [Acidobacteriota bacterium]|nr:hypothetical protein [Acidobacteriota bacterium]